ncbi:hypothetical protein EYF80_056568 [Liparis tanakae]|uniref:Uncharacterized protein n=1 Tax=Liparis tanakae TaxID=230148 RepID=A0A4Z2EWT9_9TELE|nr:hypothetical protein EYF80_056568 [Liparis tanakae]
MKAEEDGRRGASSASLVSGGLGSENAGLAATAFKKGAGPRRSTRAPFLQTDREEDVSVGAYGSRSELASLPRSFSMSGDSLKWTDEPKWCFSFPPSQIDPTRSVNSSSSSSPLPTRR